MISEPEKQFYRNSTWHAVSMCSPYSTSCNVIEEQYDRTFKIQCFDII